MKPPQSPKAPSEESRSFGWGDPPVLGVVDWLAEELLPADVSPANLGQLLPDRLGRGRLAVAAGELLQGIAKDFVTIGVVQEILLRLRDSQALGAVPTGEFRPPFNQGGINC